nr:immunoglobulin light chain junction region [Macaca mulatta]
CLQSKTSPYSF